MDASVTETYLGEWKNDKRTGFGISERSDGLRYEGEWFNNRKYGYGVTTFRDGSKEEGKYKNNVLITSQKKKHLFLIRSAKFRERIDAAVSAAQRASKIALQKADIAISRTATARGKAELADMSAEHARADSELAQQTARQFAPDFRQPGLERLRNREIPKYVPPPPQETLRGKNLLQKSGIGSHANTTTGIAEQSATSSPLKATNNPDPMANSPSQTIAQSINQSLRRASMKPAQNQMPTNSQNSNATMNNQVASQNINQTSLSSQLSPAELNQNSYGQNPYGNQQGPPNQFGNSLPGQYAQMGWLPGAAPGPYGPPGGPNQFVLQGGQYAQFQSPNNQQTQQQPPQDHYPGYPQNSSPQGFQNQYPAAYSSQQVSKNIFRSLFFCFPYEA